MGGSSSKIARQIRAAEVEQALGPVVMTALQKWGTELDQFKADIKEAFALQNEKVAALEHALTQAHEDAQITAEKIAALEAARVR